MYTKKLIELVTCTTNFEQFSKEYSSLRPESSENNTLGSQVLDLNFGKQNTTRNPNMGSKQYIFFAIITVH